MKDAILTCVATGFYSGYMKPFPGTWGTIPAWLIAFFIIGGNTPVLASTTILIFIISVWSSSVAESKLGHDSRKIVIDEWVGMFITLLFVPYSIEAYVMAFIAFRFFDVVKIPPATQFEKLPGGWGVTMDDVMAGIQANIAIQLIVFVTERYFQYSIS